MQKLAAVASQLIVTAVAILVVACTAATPDAAQRQESRPEEEPRFRNANAPVVTFRLTGEDVHQTQVSLYARDGVTYAILRVETVAGAWTERGTSSADVPELATLFQAFSKIQVNPIVDDRLYMPSVVCQVWVTGIISESYFSLRLPSEASDGVAYWGRPSEGSDSLVAWMFQVLDALSVDYVRRS